MDKDLDEFLSLVGSACAEFRPCGRHDWTSGILVDDPCPIVVSTNEHATDVKFSRTPCMTCTRRYVVCDCGQGMPFLNGERVCALLEGIHCPRIEEEYEDECDAEYDDLEDDC